MLGWHINIYKQVGDGSLPATSGTSAGRLLSDCHAGISGLDWISELVRTGHAIDLGGNGYPFRYTVRMGALRTLLSDGAPENPEATASETAEEFPRPKQGRVALDLRSIAECHRDEWLIIEAWDES